MILKGFMCTVNSAYVKMYILLKRAGRVYTFHYILAYIYTFYTITSSKIVSEGLMMANNITNKPY